ncbi:MAG TPA: DNA mismatch repair endonuclease MutL, partial [Steroidobacteraceae bacterium]|nr:DNA mismatch repair endonuclease MutL [Steroidobacteraceae bacterium]
MPIRILPEQLIHQIAAGEVIERPASVAKELLENSLDAGATRIEVDVEEGGVRLCRIRDDGCGIERDEMLLALARHATSKIATVEDLEAVGTLGFRGEALPSIASVSRMRVTSRVVAADSAFAVAAENGAFTAPVPAGHPKGTTVEVRDLFFNVPARRKFLRSERTELQHLMRTVDRLALSRFDVAWQVRSGKRRLADYPIATTETERTRRVGLVLGAEFAEQSIYVVHEAAGFVLEGWLGLPTQARSQPDLQYLYLNGRMVRDRLLASGIRQGYEDVLYHGRHPAYVLYLRMDPTKVDVNAHPAKLEVRFREPRQVREFVYRSVSRALDETRPQQAPGMRQAGFSGAGASGQATGFWPARGPAAPWPGPTASSSQVADSGPSPADGSRFAEPARAGSSADPIPAPPLGHAIAQLHGVYILAQAEGGL